MGPTETECVRVINTRKLQCDVDEELHVAFRILSIHYRITGRVLMEKLIKEEVVRYSVANDIII